MAQLHSVTDDSRTLGAEALASASGQEQVHDKQQIHGRPPDVLKLHVTEGPCSGKELYKQGDHLTVGRTRASKFHLKDPAVSEKHAVFDWTGNAWFLTDLGSSNGTRVNGAVISEGQCTAVYDGDVVQFGMDTQTRLELTPVPDEHTTVEQYLEAEYSRLVQQVKGRGQHAANRLQQEWLAWRDQLLGEFCIN